MKGTILVKLWSTVIDVTIIWSLLYLVTALCLRFLHVFYAIEDRGVGRTFIFVNADETSVPLKLYERLVALFEGYFG